MDTVEVGIMVDGWRIKTETVVWKGKTAREVQREKYPDHYFTANPTPPKSTKVGVEYPKTFRCAPYPDERPRSLTSGDVVATLTEIE